MSIYGNNPKIPNHTISQYISGVQVKSGQYRAILVTAPEIVTSLPVIRYHLIKLLCGRERIGNDREGIAGLNLKKGKRIVGQKEKESAVLKKTARLKEQQIAVAALRKIGAGSQSGKGVR